MSILFFRDDASSGTQVGAFRVRVLGFYDKAELRSPDMAVEIADFSRGPDATEFTVPSLKTYAVVDLTATQR